jgi:hypothetical protein
MGAGLRPKAKAMDWPPDPTVRAPALDPTGTFPYEFPPSHTGIGGRSRGANWPFCAAGVDDRFSLLMIGA